METSLKTPKLLAAALLLSLGFSPTRSETREQWIEWGAKIHGAFGAFIPVGIRIGLDAKERLKADAGVSRSPIIAARSRPARAWPTAS